jgi:hypothetical protein
MYCTAEAILEDPGKIVGAGFQVIKKPGTTAMKTVKKQSL